MNIEFRHGPKDGVRKFLPLGRASETIIVESGNSDWLYKKTDRYTEDGVIIYQLVSLLNLVAA